MGVSILRISMGNVEFDLSSFLQARFPSDNLGEKAGALLPANGASGIDRSQVARLNILAIAMRIRRR